MAGLSLLGAVACGAVISLIVFGATRFREASALQQITEGATFGLVLLALVAVVSTLLHTGRAIWWRPRRLASEWPGPAHHDDQ